MDIEWAVVIENLLIMFLGKGLYRISKMSDYGWDPTVPFRSLNNEGKKGVGMSFKLDCFPLTFY